MKTTNANLSKFFGLHRHTIAKFKRERYRIYTALLEYYIKINKDQ